MANVPTHHRLPIPFLHLPPHLTPPLVTKAMIHLGTVPREERRKISRPGDLLELLILIGRRQGRIGHLQ